MYTPRGARRKPTYKEAPENLYNPGLTSQRGSREPLYASQDRW